MGLGLGNSISVLVFHYMKYPVFTVGAAASEMTMHGVRGREGRYFLKNLHIKLPDLAWLILR